MLRSVVARSLLPRGLVRPFAVDASLGSVDHYFEKTRIDKSKDSERKEFTYFMFATNKFVYASAVRLGAIAFISSMSASKDVLALAHADVYASCSCSLSAFALVSLTVRLMFVWLGITSEE